MIRIFATIGMIAMLAACSTVDDPFLRTGALTPASPSLANTVSADYALATIAGLPAASVRQTVLDDQVEQTILYANVTDTTGENTLTVTIGKGVKGAPSRAGIVREMHSVLPDTAMRVSSTIGENAYGVFGYATGTMGKGGACLYAWQFARDIAPGTGMGFSRYSAQIRLRYCGPDMTADRVAMLMEGLRIRPVSQETLRTLRFATGSGGAVAASPAPVAQPFVAPSSIAASPVVGTASVRRTPQRSVVSAPVAVSAAPDEKAGIHAVKVPMPGEAAGLTQDASATATGQVAVAQEPVSRSKGTFKTLTVPLPTGVAPKTE